MGRPADGGKKPGTLKKHLAKRAGRLRKIRDAVSGGTYSVDAKSLSKAIIERHIVQKS